MIIYVHYEHHILIHTALFIALETLLVLTYTQHYNGLKYYISMCAAACFPQLHKCTNAHASRYNTRFNAHCTDLNSNPLRCPPSSFFGHYYDHQADRHVEFPGQAINDNVIKNDIYHIVNLPSA